MNASVAEKLLLGKLAFAQADASLHIPVRSACRFDDATLETAGGDLMQVLKLRGVASETADDDEITAWKTQRHAALKAIASPGLGVWFHAVRRQLDAYPGGEFAPGFAQALDAKWRQRWTRHRFFTNEFYITLVRRMPRISGANFSAALDRMFGGKKEELARRAAQERMHRQLTNSAQQLESLLAFYGARVLRADPETLQFPSLSFLGLLVNGEYQPVALPRQDLAKALAWNEVEFGRDVIRTRDRSGNAKYSAMLSVDEYPSGTLPGMLDRLLTLDSELVISQSFVFEAQDASATALKQQGARYEQVDDDAKTLADDLKVARDAVARNALLFGHHQLGVQLINSDRAELTETITEAVTKLAGFGLVALRETRGLEPAYWARLPGNQRYAARAARISSANLACFASYHSVPEGKIAGNHWGPAISALSTTAGTPYFFNFHAGDLGHTVLIGGSGSGKTTAQGFLIAQAQRCRPRTWVFDKDRGAEILVRALGGTYTVIRAGEPTGWNPLQLEPSKQTASFLTDLIVALAYRADEAVPPRELEEIAWAVDRTLALPMSDRRLSELAAFISKRAGDQALWRRLAPWHGSGSLAWLFDNPTDSLELDDTVLGFDMTTLLDNELVCGPALAYIFERVARSLRAGDSRGSIISVEEVQHFLRHDVFAARLEDWALTIRKANGLLISSTQKAETLLETRAGRTLLEQSATQILFPNSKASREKLASGWNLSEKEISLVLETPRESRAFLVRGLTGSVLISLDLSEMPDEIAVLSGTAERVRVCEAIRREVGNDPAVWLPLYLDAQRKERAR
jgi:type IV secretion system protein VirB4